MKSSEFIDEGVKSKMAAAGLAGLIAGANLPDAPNNSTTVNKPSSYSTQAQQTKIAKFEVESWHPWRKGQNYGYQVNLNILKPVRLICRLYDSSNRVVGQSGTESYGPGWARELINNETGRDATKLVCQEVN